MAVMQHVFCTTTVLLLWEEVRPLHLHDDPGPMDRRQGDSSAGHMEGQIVGIAWGS